MGTCIRYAVKCDGEGCEELYVSHNSWGLTQAMHEAVNHHGWAKDGRKAYCPTCAVKKSEDATK